MGGVDGGFVLYVQEGKLTYGYNYVADKRFKVQSDSTIPEGDHIFSFEFIPTGKADVANGKGVPATIKLLVDGEPVGSGDLPVTIPLQLGLSAGVCVGADSGASIMDTDYEAPPIQRHRQKGVGRYHRRSGRGQGREDADVSLSAVRGCRF
jgi:hypothetical protein